MYVCMYMSEGSPCGVLANVLDCDIIVSEIELQSCYYIRFQTNTVGKSMNPFIPPSNYGLNNTTIVILQG